MIVSSYCETLLTAAAQPFDRPCFPQQIGLPALIATFYLRRLSPPNNGLAGKFVLRDSPKAWQFDNDNNAQQLLISCRQASNVQNMHDNLKTGLTAACVLIGFQLMSQA